MMKKEFRVPYGKHELVGDIISDGNAPSLLYLHGAGASNRRRFDPLRDMLAEQGIGSVAFDFTGTGDTGGDLRSSSLRERVEEAEAVVSHLQLPAPLSLVGSSMGAYVAVKLTEKFRVENLILFVPAFYTRAAYAIPFNAGFTEIIRTPGSWQDSDAWEMFGGFKGNVLVFAAGKDEVIPKELIERIGQGVPQAASKEVVVFPDADHGIGRYFGEDSVAFKLAGEKIAALMRGQNHKM